MIVPRYIFTTKNGKELLIDSECKLPYRPNWWPGTETLILEDGSLLKVGEEYLIFYDNHWQWAIYKGKEKELVLNLQLRMVVSPSKWQNNYEQNLKYAIEGKTLISMSEEFWHNGGIDYEIKKI